MKNNKLKKIIVIVLIIATVLSLCSAAIIYFMRKASTSSASPAAEAQSGNYVENKEIDIYLLKTKKNCLYTGMLDSTGTPEGEGHYEIENDDGSICSFDGESYSHHLYAGTVENYPIYYGNSNVKYVSYYSGEIKKGIPNGEGTLVVSGTDNDFTYTGSWVNGKYNGYGELIYTNSNMMKYKGTFKLGSFKPSFTELVEALCSPGSFEMSKEAREYLAENEEAFLEHDSSGANFDSGMLIIYGDSAGNPDNRSFKIHMTVAQKIEYPEDTFGFPLTEILGYTDSGKNIYDGYYFGYSDAISEGKTADIILYPIGYGHYYESAGSEMTALRFIAYEVGD